MKYLPKVLLASVLLVLSFGLFTPTSNHKFQATASTLVEHAATHFIEQDTIAENAICSATAIGPHALLTAAHCVTGTGNVIIDGTAYKIVKTLYDEEEHAVYITDATFSVVAKVVQREAIEKESVHIWGNPGGRKNVYRVGQFLEKGRTFMEALQGFPVYQKYILPVFPGDSGSGIFDVDGNLIGVVSMGGKDATALAFPLQFTEAQMDEALCGNLQLGLAACVR